MGPYLQAWGSSLVLEAVTAVNLLGLPPVLNNPWGWNRKRGADMAAASGPAWLFVKRHLLQ